MAGNEEFSFENEENSETGTDIPPTKEKDPISPEDRRKGSRTRLLFLVLLLAAGAGIYSFSGNVGVAEPIASSPQVAAKQPIAVPPRPLEDMASNGEDAAVDAEGPAPESRVAEASQVVEESTLPGKDGEIIQVASGEKAEAPIKGEPKPPVPAAQDGAAVAEHPEAYVVAAGAFLLRSNLAEAEKKVYESGFVPQVVQRKKPLDMTRLRVGTYPLREGRKKMEELSEVAPDAFCLPAEDGVAVYAASFRSIDKARNFADRLYQEGLRVEEESVRIEIPLYLLSFGDFPDREEARRAAGQARAAGLDTMVIKKP